MSFAINLLTNPEEGPEATFALDAVCKQCFSPRLPVKGLAILPVVPTVAPNYLREDVDFQKLDSRYIANGERLPGDTKDGDPAKNLRAYWYVLRSLPEGFLYVFKPDQQTWEMYVVDESGLFCRRPFLEVGPVVANSCIDGLASEFIVIGPESSEVWLAYSRYAWTESVLRLYGENQTLRSDRMSYLNVKAAAEGQLGSTSTVNIGASMDKRVGTLVVDYAPWFAIDRINAKLVTPVRNRSGRAFALADEMARVSSETRAKTGAVIMLKDHLGLVIEANAQRNAEAGMLADYINGNLRKRFVADCILKFRKAHIDNGELDTWNTRYLKHYDHEKMTTEKNVFDKVERERNELIDRQAHDVVLLVRSHRKDDPKCSPHLKAWWFDFDPTDDRSAHDLQDAVAKVLDGWGKIPEERQLLDTLLNEPTNDPTAMLWSAVTALNADLGEFMFGKSLPDVGKTDKLIEAAKNLHEVGSEVVKGVKKYRAKLKARTNDAAMARIGLTMAGQLTRLAVSDPSSYKIVGMRILMAIAVRTDTTIVPAFVSTNVRGKAQMLAEAAFGPPNVEVKLLHTISGVRRERIFVAESNAAGVFAWQGRLTTSVETHIFEVWLPQGKVKDYLALPGTNVELLLPESHNPFDGLVEFTKSTPGVFAWVGLTLQALNLISSARDLRTDSDNKSDAKFGVVAGTLGVLGLTAEIASKALQKQATSQLARFANRLEIVGGILGALSSFTDSVQAMVNAQKRLDAEDYDAAICYGGAALFLYASGIVGLAEAGLLVAGIPGLGWIAAAIMLGAAALALVCSWFAIKSSNNPLEVWLLGCIYGRGANSSRFSEEEERRKLNTIVMNIEVGWQGDPWEPPWHSSGDPREDYDDFYFSVNLPGASEVSMVEYKITLIDRLKRSYKVASGRLTLGSEWIFIDGNALGKNKRESIGPPKPNAQSSPLPFVPAEIPNFYSTSWGFRFGARLRVDDDFFERGEVEFQYWPDPEMNPNLVMPLEEDKRIFGDEDWW